MPELPEVETTRLGIKPFILGKKISSIIIRQPRLRWPVDTALSSIFTDQQLIKVDRRAKYLILQTQTHYLLIHLGMSGSLRLIDPNCFDNTEIQKHDHVDIVFEDGFILRYRDPRRFGAILSGSGDPLMHKLLVDLGPEPLSKQFELESFYQRSRSKKCSIKQYIMDGKVVVGVGNIYACEALFLSAVKPDRVAAKVSFKAFQLLHKAIVQVLTEAIAKGGTTLKDFVAPKQNNRTQAGYFQQQLSVYGRENQPCHRCQTIILQQKIAQRSSFYCPFCQS